jgi:hypothetical protein
MHEMMEHLNSMLIRKRFALIDMTTGGGEVRAVYERADCLIEATAYDGGCLSLKATPRKGYR